MKVRTSDMEDKIYKFHVVLREKILVDTTYEVTASDEDEAFRFVERGWGDWNSDEHLDTLDYELVKVTRL